MKCSEARALFSSRVDEEIGSEILARLERHLIHCEECGIAWINFRSTVDLLRGLPQETADPSFVGQVLDRVRAFEAEETAGMEYPIDALPPRPGGATWRNRIQAWFTLSPRFQPAAAALAVGCLAIGVLVGALGSQLSTGTLGLPEVDVAATSGVDPGAATPAESAMASAPGSPFSDIADRVRAQEPARSASVPTDLLSPNWSGGLQQQVRYENEAPRIIF